MSVADVQAKIYKRNSSQQRPPLAVSLLFLQYPLGTTITMIHLPQNTPDPPSSRHTLPLPHTPNHALPTIHNTNDQSHPNKRRYNSHNARQKGNAAHIASQRSTPQLPSLLVAQWTDILGVHRGKDGDDAWVGDAGGGLCR